jgi:hypothetical protein
MGVCGAAEVATSKNVFFQSFLLKLIFYDGFNFFVLFSRFYFFRQFFVVFFRDLIFRPFFVVLFFFDLFCDFKFMDILLALNFNP